MSYSRSAWHWTMSSEEMAYSPWHQPAKYRETEGEKDIDTDFAPSIRDKVIGYVAKRYAYKEDYIEELKGTVCAINTEGVLAAKAPFDRLAKLPTFHSPLATKSLS